MLLAAACGSQSPAGSAPDATDLPDPPNLVVHLADLPAGFTPVPGESLRTPLEWVLADPWSVGARALIRRERVGAYQRSFWTRDRERIECSAALYRSSRGARQVFGLRTGRFGAFAATHLNGRWTRVPRIGDQSTALRAEGGGWRGLAVLWRYRAVLSSCTTASLRAATMRWTVELARLQQKRIADALG